MKTKNDNDKADDKGARGRWPGEEGTAAGRREAGKMCALVLSCSTEGERGDGEVARCGDLSAGPTMRMRTTHTSCA